MTIDVSAILKETGGKMDVDGEAALSDTEFLGETYRFTAPLKIKGHISNNGKSLILNAVCEGEMITECARCMKDITVPINFLIDENLVRAGEEASEDDDVIVFEDTQIDLDDIAAACFLMNIEGRYLCRDDCKGLCPECGADLNEGDCGCRTDTIDPRWSALADIINKDKQ